MHKQHHITLNNQSKIRINPYFVIHFNVHTKQSIILYAWNSLSHHTVLISSHLN